MYKVGIPGGFGDSTRTFAVTGTSVGAISVPDKMVWLCSIGWNLGYLGRFNCTVYIIGYSSIKHRVMMMISVTLIGDVAWTENAVPGQRLRQIHDSVGGEIKSRASV